MTAPLEHDPSTPPEAVAASRDPLAQIKELKEEPIQFRCLGLGCGALSVILVLLFLVSRFI
jgi:hypothetical protein